MGLKTCHVTRCLAGAHQVAPCTHTHDTHRPVVNSPFVSTTSGSATATGWQKRVKNHPRVRGQGMTESSLQALITHTLSMSTEHRPFPHTYLDYRLAYLHGRKTVKVRINLLEPGRGKQPAGKAPGARGPSEPGPWRWRDRPAAAGTSGRKVSPAAAPHCSLAPWGGDWRKAEGWEGED